MSSFVKLVQPPGNVILQYPTDDPHSRPPPSIPAGFAEAMIVRKEVFVIEQGCRLETEIDGDDQKSYHWVVYASVGAPKSTSPKTESPEQPVSEYKYLKSIGGQVPIGTLRLVPAPHPPHPRPGSIDGVGGAEVKRVDGGDQETTFHDGKELYVKFGRMATISEYRRLGLGNLLMGKAMEWAANNQRALSLIPSDALEKSKLSTQLGGKLGLMEWKGLVMAHSQKNAVTFYEKLGFVEDAELGSWFEEGIEHVAMWKRLEIKK